MYRGNTHERDRRRADNLVEGWMINLLSINFSYNRTSKDGHPLGQTKVSRLSKRGNFPIEIINWDIEIFPS